MELNGMRINMRNWVVSVLDNDYWKALLIGALHLLVSQAIELVNNFNRIRIIKISVSWHGCYDITMCFTVY